MTRTVARQLAVHLIFASGFDADGAQRVLDDALTPEHFALLAPEDSLYAVYPDAKQEAYIRTLVTGVAERRAELDEYIVRYAVGWSFARIPRVARAIMAAAMYEVLYMPDVPDAAAIDAAVEIAKNYETPEVVAFINGILGSFTRDRAAEADSDKE